jgi:hypothetical protein
MRGVAHIFFEGGALFVPVSTPYEREQLVEHVQGYTSRYGRVLLELNRRRWTISLSKELRAVCAACSKWPERFTYPGGASGRFSVVCATAAPCTDRMCGLAQAGAGA